VPWKPPFDRPEKICKEKETLLSSGKLKWVQENTALKVVRSQLYYFLISLCCQMKVLVTARSLLCHMATKLAISSSEAQSPIDRVPEKNRRYSRAISAARDDLSRFVAHLRMMIVIGGMISTGTKVRSVALTLCVWIAAHPIRPERACGQMALPNFTALTNAAIETFGPHYFDQRGRAFGRFVLRHFGIICIFCHKGLRSPMIPLKRTLSLFAMG
jgi:hypothetical protein